ncbi:MAG: hypothetical protein ACREQ5_05630 [Candidatus Dormibacteria bacterium]
MRLKRDGTPDNRHVERELDRGVYLPTLSQIASACDCIRSRWSDGDERVRRGLPREPEPVDIMVAGIDEPDLM